MKGWKVFKLFRGETESMTSSVRSCFPHHPTQELEEDLLVSGQSLDAVAPPILPRQG